MDKRSLYQCSRAIVSGGIIHCNKQHELGGNDTIDMLRLKRGEPLEFTVCQDCKDFSSMGNPIAPEDRGWEKKKKEDNHA